MFALDPQSYSARWVYVHDSDLVGANAQDGGVAIADDAGKFVFLGARSGSALWKESSGLTSTVARLPHGGGGAADVAGG